MSVSGIGGLTGLASTETQMVTKVQSTSWWARNFTKANLIKYGAVTLGGVALGVTGLATLRPTTTYQTGQGNIYTQQAQQGDWFSGILQGIMPLFMMAMMLPMMQGMFTGMAKKKEED